MFHGSSEPSLTFPTEHPHGQLRAHVEPGRALGEPLSWDLYTVALGSRRAMHDSYEEHLRYLASAGYEWDDELRFDDEGRLAGLVLKIGEQGPLPEAVARSYLALPRTRGLPVVGHHRHAAHLTPETLRCLADDARALVVLSREAPSADASALRLAVHDELDLLFCGGRYVGWCLAEPLELLAGASELAPEARTADPRHASLGAVLRDYLALVVGDTLAAMERGDHQVLVALEALRARVLELRGHDPVADGLASRIEELIETFYG